MSTSTKDVPKSMQEPKPGDYINLEAYNKAVKEYENFKRRLAIAYAGLHNLNDYRFDKPE